MVQKLHLNFKEKQVICCVGQNFCFCNSCSSCAKGEMISETFQVTKVPIEKAKSLQYPLM